MENSKYSGIALQFAWSLQCYCGIVCTAMFYLLTEVSVNTRYEDTKYRYQRGKSMCCCFICQQSLEPIRDKIPNADMEWEKVCAAMFYLLKEVEGILDAKGEIFESVFVRAQN